MGPRTTMAPVSESRRSPVSVALNESYGCCTPRRRPRCRPGTPDPRRSRRRTRISTDRTGHRVGTGLRRIEDLAARVALSRAIGAHRVCSPGGAPRHPAHPGGPPARLIIVVGSVGTSSPASLSASPAGSVVKVLDTRFHDTEPLVNFWLTTSLSASVRGPERPAAQPNRRFPGGVDRSAHRPPPCRESRRWRACRWR